MSTCLCWGTVEGVGALELARVAALAGFDTISLTPAMVLEGAEQAGSIDGLAGRIADAGVGMAMIDPLMRGLPGAPEPDQVGRRFRSTFLHGEDVVLDVALGLGAQAVNVAHFLGADTPTDALVEHLAGVAERFDRHGLTLLVEFMPEGSIPDLATAAAIVAGIGRPNVALTVDTWHLARTGEGPTDVAALPPGMVGVVQVADGGKDIIGTWTSPPTAERLQLGQGALPLVNTLRIVAERHPQAVVAVEVFDRHRADDPAEERAGDAAASLRSVLGQLPPA
ncbi:MAG: sugar phosphate isomerase/epimerase [Acidimicrobiales bacterium]|nr:sugar phosphate isomerase/epimerase [Acidimicrobiales bacterium]